MQDKAIQMNTTPLLNELKKIINVSPKDFTSFSKSINIIKLKKKEIWEQEGKISQFMGFVNSGVLRQYRLKDGQEFTTDFFMENEFIGNYVSYQTQSPSLMITQAIEDCEIVALPVEVFEQFYEAIPGTKEAADIIGKQKLLNVHNRNSSLLMDTPEERYYKLMEQKPALFNRVPQYLIAQYLGIRPESLSRIRKRHKS